MVFHAFKVQDLYVYAYMRSYVLEMQQYINTLPYCDTLCSDTVLIHIYCYIEYCDTYTMLKITVGGWLVIRSQ